MFASCFATAIADGTVAGIVESPTLTWLLVYWLGRALNALTRDRELNVLV
jgi:hypothetical protein